MEKLITKINTILQNGFTKFWEKIMRALLYVLFATNRDFVQMLIIPITMTALMMAGVGKSIVFTGSPIQFVLVVKSQQSGRSLKFPMSEIIALGQPIINIVKTYNYA